MFGLSDLKEDLVGVESRIQEIETLLSYRSTNVYTLGIWGSGGIGKTAIARAIFNKISSSYNFDGSYFIEDVGLEERIKGNLAYLPRGRFLPPTLHEHTVMHNCKKLLIVLDDVTDPGQIKSLIGSFDPCMPGSLIIITTRDKQVLEICGVKTIYELKQLTENDALMLFQRHAFRQNYPNVRYVELSKEIVYCIRGAPLTLKVLGCFLFGKSIEIWLTVARKLQRISPLTINEMLKISCDGLDSHEQNIFQYIARFLNGEHRDHVINVLDRKGYFAERGMSVLVDKCLITVLGNKIKMHHLLQEVGMKLGRKKLLDAHLYNRRMGDHEETVGLLTDDNFNEVLTYNTVDLGKMFAIINFILELPSAVFDQLSSAHKPQYAILSMSLSFMAMLLCITELVYKCGEEKIRWKWRSKLPWLYYPSRNYGRPFGNFKDIIGLVCSICQCIFVTITFNFVRRRADNPVQVSFWPIVFAFGLLCSKFLEKPVNREENIS